MMNNERSCSYNGADQFMPEQIQMLHDLFVTYKADFIDFDFEFDDPFATDWQTAIEAAIPVGIYN